MLLVVFAFTVPWLLSSLVDQIDITIYYRGAVVVVFLVIVLAINGFFTWLSLAVTRWLMAVSQRFGGMPWHRLGYGALGCLATLFSMAGLVASLYGCIILLNWLAALNGLPEFYTVVDLLQGIAVDPNHWNYWWIYAMLFSTVLPNFAHMVIALAALAITIRLPITRTRIAELLNDVERGGHNKDGKAVQASRKATRLLTLQPTALLVFGGWLISMLLGWLLYSALILIL